MDESMGAHYALQVALQTMKERCQQLQKQVSILEEENISLKLKCATQESNDNSLTEIDMLRSKIAGLTEEKQQLRNNVALVTSENRQLWSRLSKLTQDNKSLGSKLTKITDSINQHTKGHNPLIRSKTFTQEAPHTKHLQKALIENDKISLELEDISLKLLSSISKEKTELEMQCNEMAQLQKDAILTNSFGFTYLGEEIEDSMADDFEQHLNDLRYIKSMLELENEKLTKNVNNLESIKVETCKKCAESETNKVILTVVPEDDIDTKKELESLAKWGKPEQPVQLIGNKTNEDFICPVCSLRYSRTSDFNVFLGHVETHFSMDDKNL